MNIPWKITTRIIAAVLVLALCGLPELGQAQQTQPPAGGQTPPANNPDSAMPNPAQPPLKPAETLPEAPSATPSQTLAPNAAQKPAEQTQAPAGAAAAQAGITAGGAASKPAGTAIAPAKQHQTRSLLIKIGALGGAAVAIGTIVGLSRATGSKPPGAR